MWVSKKFKYTPLFEAHQIVTEATKGKARQESVSVFQAYNRVLAEDIKSDVDLPSASISHFDGYAVRAEDTSQASINNTIFLRVVGKIYLDEEYKGELNSGEAAYISTGAKLPDGADAVIPVEMARSKDGFIKIRHSVRPYENVIPSGRDVKREETIFKVGKILRAQDIKLLMDIKKWRVKVFRKPVVAILSVGSELTNRIEETDLKKFNSQGLMISTLVKEAGGVSLNLGIAPDDMGAIKRLLREGLKKADIVASIGGASVGERDYVWGVTNRLGESQELIRGIKVHPGRVTSLSIVDDKPIVILPGHIQSTVVGFISLLLPLVRLMSGLPSPTPLTTLKAKMYKEMVIKEFVPFERIRFVKVTRVADDYMVKPVTGDSSLTSVVSKTNGFIVIPKGKKVVKEGEAVNVHFINGLFPFD